MRFSIATITMRFGLAILTAGLLATTGCALEDDDYGTRAEELNSIRGIRGVGAGLSANPTPNPDPYAVCTELYDLCVQICDELTDFQDDVMQHKECVVKCEMEFINCIDDVDGAGGPVNPF